MPASLNRCTALAFAAGLALTLSAAARFGSGALTEVTVALLQLDGCSLTRVEATSIGAGAWRPTWACPNGRAYVR
jgi:hypothetical protein